MRAASGLVAALGLALLAPGCTAPITPSPDAMAEAHPAWDRAQFGTNSWGRVVSGWTIGPQGQGEWHVRENENGQPGPIGAYRVTYHAIALNDAQVQQLAALLDSLPDPAPDSGDCREFRTDMYYGELRLTQGADTREVAWNEGCMDAGYRAFLARLQRADALVAGVGRAAPVTRVERFKSDGSRAE